MTPRRIIAIAVLVTLCALVAHAGDRFGRVCITPIPSGERWDANESHATENSQFSIQMDKLPPVLVTTNASGVVTNLSLAGDHLVKIQVDGKPLTSFKFSFNGRGDHLRLWYNPFYGSWSLSDVHPGEKCACPETSASNKPGPSKDRIALKPGW